MLLVGLFVAVPLLLRAIVLARWPDVLNFLASTTFFAPAPFGDNAPPSFTVGRMAALTGLPLAEHYQTLLLMVGSLLGLGALGLAEAVVVPGALGGGFTGSLGSLAGVVAVYYSSLSLFVTFGKRLCSPHEALTITVTAAVLFWLGDALWGFSAAELAGLGRGFPGAQLRAYFSFSVRLAAPALRALALLCITTGVLVLYPALTATVDFARAVDENLRLLRGKQGGLRRAFRQTKFVFLALFFFNCGWVLLTAGRADAWALVCLCGVNVLARLYLLGRQLPLSGAPTASACLNAASYCERHGRDQTGQQHHGRAQRICNALFEQAPATALRAWGTALFSAVGLCLAVCALRPDGGAPFTLDYAAPQLAARLSATRLLLDRQCAAEDPALARLSRPGGSLASDIVFYRLLLKALGPELTSVLAWTTTALLLVESGCVLLCLVFRPGAAAATRPAL